MKTDLLHSTAAALLAGLLLLPVTLPDSARATESPTAALSAEAIDRLSPAGRTAGAPAGPAGLLYGLPGAPSPVLTQKHLVYAPDSPGAAASNTSDATN